MSSAPASSSVLHPAIASASPMEAVSSPAPRARSTSRGRASKEASVSNDGQSRAASHGRSPGSSNIPLPSPSAVHINQSLEDSLRRNEEERIRRSAERRERRWRRLEQSKQSQSRNAQPGSSSSAVTNDKARIILEDTREGGNVSVDSLDDESALVTSPVLPSPEHVQAQVADDDSSDGQGAYYYEGYGDDFDSETEELDGRSLTRQLAETAVSVREMSRELGRARVKSNVQSVLIVTKARDNQLIKLTREIALYLMKTPRYGRSRGLIVYVDSQLKKSKRFDAAGIERDNPSLFRNETRHHHHHHHHHSHHHSNQNHTSASTQGGSTPAGSATPRRSSSRRTSNHSTGATSINLFGMTRSDLGNSTASLSGLDRSYLNSHSSQSSGATTPAPGLSKPMTKLTEALVTRQIDRQLEKENARRQSQSAGQGTNGVADGTRTPGQRVAFATTAAQNENGSPASNNNSGDEQTGLLRYWTAEMCSKSPQLFDLVLTLGGDGTVLFTSWLFQHVVPPVIPFALGSLGFLTNFDFSNYKSVLEMAINEGVRVNLRMRFTATIYRAVHEDDQDESRDKHTRVIRSAESGQLYLETSEPGQWTKLESGPRHAGSSGRKDREVKCSITRPVESFEVLNDLVVDRGPSPYVSLLELFGDEHHLTTVQADGLCVATPTGSTAYSLSAGGSLVHPEIPTLLITPICPHTLSFRPMLLPDSMDLRIAVPYNSRSTAWASFDGRGRVELRQGDHIKVTASTYPFPTVCADKQSTDWFQAITRTLKWNERERQKSFVMLEHDRKEPHDSTLSKAQAENGYKTGAVPLSRGSEASKTSVGATSSAKDKDQTSTSTSLQEESEDDDDGKFDIDDISSNPLPATAVPVEQEKQNAPVSLSSSWEASTSTERNQGVSIVRPPVQPGFQRDDGPKSPSEYDLSHSSAQHLRQYDTYPREGSNGNSSARDRTPRGSSFSRTPTSQISAAAENPRPRSRGSIRRSHRTHTRHNGERVKAFVVFGADSSDLDSSSASGDESDETAIRQACQP